MPIEILTNQPGTAPTTTLEQPADTVTVTEPTVALETKQAEFTDQTGQTATTEKDNSLLWLAGVVGALLFFMLKKKKRK